MAAINKKGSIFCHTADVMLQVVQTDNSANVSLCFLFLHCFAAHMWLCIKTSFILALLSEQLITFVTNVCLWRSVHS